MKKTLVIGCGNIGAMYDFENDEVQTYAKALSNNPLNEVWVYDLDPIKMMKVANKYNFHHLSSLDHFNWNEIDLLCIATSTPSHANYLKIGFNSNIKTIICEKPVAGTLAELEELEKDYKSSNTVVLVNYIRRFQPAYVQLQKEISNYSKDEFPNSITINYCRGLLNNGSHALDLIEFLLNIELSLTHVEALTYSFDAFETDPTATLTIIEDKFTIKMNGIPNAEQSIFELYFHYSDLEISMTQSGNTIAFNTLKEGKTIRAQDALKNYMHPIIERAGFIAENFGINDNFISSIKLNSKIVSLIQKYCNE